MTTRRTFFLQVLGSICAPMLPKAVTAACTPGIGPVAAKATPRRIVSRAALDLPEFHGSLSGRGFIEICKRIEAKEAIWRAALGVPRGFEIPEKPLPASRAEREAELAVVTKLMDAAFEASLALPPGPERRSQAAAMVAYSSHRTRLMLALRDGEIGTKALEADY